MPEEDEEDEGGMHEQLEQAESIKDDLVPLALEYYLGCIDIGSDGDSDDDEDGGSSDGDGEEKKPKKKKKSKKGGKGELPPGMDGKDCK